MRRAEDDGSSPSAYIAGRLGLMDIAAFITARLDEVEADAREAQVFGGANAILAHVAVDGDADTTRALGAHILRHDPARVLADIAAKRQMLRLWQEMDGSDSSEVSGYANDLMGQLLAPYGKRAVFTRKISSGPLSWDLEDLHGGQSD